MLTHLKKLVSIMILAKNRPNIFLLDFFKFLSLFESADWARI